MCGLLYLHQRVAQCYFTFIIILFSDELKIAEKRLKGHQKRRLDDYVGKLKENKDDDDAVKAFKDVFVDLRILKEKDGYKRLETRTHHNLIQLEKDVEKCQPVSLAELFQPERVGCSPPRRMAIEGKAGIGMHYFFDLFF